VVRNLSGFILAFMDHDTKRICQRYDVSMDSIAAHYLDEIRRQLRGHKRMAEGALAQLKDDDFFVTLDPESNSVAILIKHVSGNMRSRFTDFLTTDGEKPDRHRDTEFEITSNTSREELMRWWEEGWTSVFAALDSLTPDDVMRTIYIRQEPHTVVQALNRALAHYAFHLGQVIFLAKHLRSTDWKTLTVPRGKSEEFNRMSLEERRKIGHPLAPTQRSQKD
jgi:Protein of unknown function (DUF1572)